MGKGYSHHVFISYSRKDKEIAKKVKSDLESICLPNGNKIKCWIDITGIESSKQFQDVIIRNIKSSAIVLLLLSKNSMNSEWTKKEIDFAKSKNKVIIPVRIDQEPFEDWYQFEFGTLNYREYSDADQMNALNRELKIKLNDVVIVENADEVKSAVQPKWYNSLCWIQIGFFALFFVAFSYILVSKNHVWKTPRDLYNVMLCLSLCGVAYSTYMLKRNQRFALPLMAGTEFLAVLFFCLLASEKTRYYGWFYSLTLNNFRWAIQQFGLWLPLFIKELLVALHMLLVCYLTELKKRISNV